MKKMKGIDTLLDKAIQHLKTIAPKKVRDLSIKVIPEGNGYFKTKIDLKLKKRTLVAIKSDLEMKRALNRAIQAIERQIERMHNKTRRIHFNKLSLIPVQND